MKTRATSTAVNFSWLIRRDLPDVLRIEDAVFPHPWDEAAFLECLRHRNCIGLLARDVSGEAVGYMVYEMHKTRLVLLTLAVAPGRQREGVGRALMKRLLVKLHPDRRTSISARVRERNLPAQLFLRSLGFRCVSIDRDGYAAEWGTDEAAYLFRYAIDAEPATLANRIAHYFVDEPHGRS